MNKSITIQIDTKTRELPYIVILKSLFEVNGEIELIPTYQDPIWHNGKSDFFKTIRKKSEILITPSYNSNRTHYTLLWKYLSGSKLVKWHSEQLFDKRFYNEKLNLNALGTYNRDVDFHIVWGERLAKLLVEKSNIDPNRIYITGCPKFDLLYSDKLLSECLPKNKNNKIVFVSDFTLANMSEDKYQKLLRAYKYDKSFKLREFYTKAFKKFYNIIKTISKSYTSCEIIIRLHPGEPIEPYSELLTLDNIHVKQDESFSATIADTNIVVQFLSTSFFESILAGKTVFCLDLMDEYTGHWREHYQYYNFIKPDVFVNNFDEIQNNKFTQQSGQSENGMRDLFSTHLGMSIPRTYYALNHILQRTDGGWSNLIIDKARITKTAYQFYIKQLLAKLFFGAHSAGLLTNNKTKYITDNFYGCEEEFTESEVDSLVKDYITSNSHTLNEALTSNCSFNLTDYGIEVSV